MLINMAISRIGNMANKRNNLNKGASFFGLYATNFTYTLMLMLMLCLL
jgi:hypothetical protein